jgi:dimethylsulfoniopropionate demethylase
MKKFNIAKSRRLRSTPYSSRIESQGVTAYTIYNHMLLPAAFGSLEDSYHHLKEHVQIWDVAAERQVEISGPDAYKLVQLMTCRDLSKSKIGRCYYCPIIDDNGGMINDPVILKLKEDKWWISIADSDVILFAKGLAIGNKLNVKIIEPNVNILAVQGPKSFKLMEIARSGWSKQGGYEIYVEHTKSGLQLYDKLFDEGKEFNVKPGCPNLIERIESGLLSYGNDIDNEDNPYECGLDKYVNVNSDINFLGKDKLIQYNKNGLKKKLMGVKIESDSISITETIKIFDNNENHIGELRSGVYSPHFNKVIGIAMLKKPNWNTGTKIKININGKSVNGTVCDLPFI